VKLKKLFLACILLLSSTPVFAWNDFVIKDIRVSGLSRIPLETVFNYMPLGIGDQFNEDQSQKLIKILFKSGFFKDVILTNEDNILEIHLTEQPAIRKIEILGNRNLNDESLRGTLKHADIVEGKLFREASLKNVIDEIKQSYYDTGRFAVVVVAATTPRPDNSVDLNIEIREGSQARVKELNFIGNKAYDTKVLRRLSTFSGNVFTNILLGKNKYTEEKLAMEVDSLNNFYQDQGYLEFAIQSKSVEMSDDKKDVVITFTIFEGASYHFGSVAVDRVDVLTDDKVMSFVQIKEGEKFSRSAVISTKSAIEAELANLGYAFAIVNPIPSIDRQKNIVSFALSIDSGLKTYVRRIDITGNATTQDVVIRREMRQMEGTLYSRKNISRSQQRIQRLGYFDEISIDVKPVPDSVDEVDLEFGVVERKTGNLTFGIGYSEDERGFVQAEISRKNLFGSGRQLEARLDQSQVKQVYEIEYVNPYFTDNGISRSIFAKQKNVDASAGSSAGYIANSKGMGIRFSIPTSEYNALDLSGEYESIELVSLADTPLEYNSFINTNSKSENVLFKTSFSQDTRDRIRFPEKGHLTSISSELSAPGSAIEYFKVTLNSTWYGSLSDNLVLGLYGGLGYGGGYGDTESLPFYRNFFAGGASSVRGYKSRSLGPRSQALSNAKPLGGDRRFLANANLYFPVPGLRNGEDTRLSIFVDAGEVYGTEHSFTLSALNFTTGVSFNWFTAIGPLAISYGVPINPDTGSRTRRFQISFGTMFQ
tara:strand:- start:5590 stop:7881 length:2292 start_codon:yes stop_codon:yes gene_type:complete